MKADNLIVLVLIVQGLVILFHFPDQNYKILIVDRIFSFDDILNEPLILVGGYMSSGTSLIRSILDVHPECKCGPEIKISFESLKLVESLNETKINQEKMEKAMGIFSYFTYMTNVEPTYHICNKEPGNLRFISYFKRVFPRSKFLMVVRDGREAAYSWINRNGMGKNFKIFFSVLKAWNKFNNQAYNQCIETGLDYCKIIYYNKLVTNAEEEIGEMAKFLNLKWTDRFLNHQKYLGKDIKLAKHEYSLYGIKKQINADSLNNWVGKISDYDEELVANEIDMLRTYKFIS
ncbi:hypothetical protein BpHYR1_044289 [Brachionus plicatilis]|uniref:Protein-tyrosine sulfotransferase n=1 Tax=Brachionus plicatilis TaxID=10195 RepID=A0A3M7PD72_BRAPC|nr:hypothetical protein BpHYR1_044289 [Brachionus plicatilis]